jgi:hypothetical protein
MQESMTNTIEAVSCEYHPLRAEGLGGGFHSILSPIPLYPRPLLRLPDPDDDPRDPSTLNHPADNAITFMQPSNFQKCASPPHPSPPQPLPR